MFIFNKGRHKSVHCTFSSIFLLLYNDDEVLLSILVQKGDNNPFHAYSVAFHLIVSAASLPVGGHLQQLAIERSAEGRDDGDERQETPCTVLAC